MKKLFTLFASGLFTVAAFAQCTPVPLPEPKFEPNPDSARCIEQGVPYTEVFYFKIPATAGAFTIEYMKIDSVTNLPAGLTPTLNKGFGVAYNGNETGCVTVTGTTSAAAGQYRLGLYVALKVTLLPTELKGDLYTVAKSQNVADAEKYILFLSLTSPTGTCPCIDTAGQLAVGSVKTYDGTEPQCAYRPVPGSTGTSIDDLGSLISGLNIVPNPFSSSATVEFNAETAGTYTARITNLIGKEVMRETTDVTVGSNNININRNNLSAGVYFFSLSNGKSLVTKRFIIE